MSALSDFKCIRNLNYFCLPIHQGNYLQRMLVEKREERLASHPGTLKISHLTLPPQSCKAPSPPDSFQQHPRHQSIHNRTNSHANQAN